MADKSIIGEDRLKSESFGLSEPKTVITENIRIYYYFENQQKGVNQYGKKK